MPNHFYVYIYLNPLKPGKFTYGEFLSFSFEPFYVGKGKGKQLFRHLKEVEKTTCNPFKVRVINKIRKQGFEPIIIKLNFGLTNDQANELEKFYIKTIGRRDLILGPLTNLTDGGDGNVGWSDAQKETQSTTIKKLWTEEKRTK